MNVYDTVHDAKEVIHVWIKTTCDNCGSILEYNDKSVCEGDRDFEDVYCPVCNNIVGRVFTDLIPEVRIVEKGKEDI